MRKIKKLLIMAFTFCMFIAFGIGALATETATILTDYENEMPDAIQRYMEAINKGDWESFISAYSPEMQEDLYGLLSFVQSGERIGILKVNTISINEAKELPSTHLYEIEPYFANIDFAKYEDVKFYYIGFMYDVCEESEFFYNGVKYSVMAVGTLDGESYIVGHEYAYFPERFEKFGYEFNSKNERKAYNIVEQREQGVIVNFENEVLETYESSSNEIVDDIPEETKVEETIPSETNSISQEQRDKEKSDLDHASQGRVSIEPKSPTSPPSKLKLWEVSKEKMSELGFDEYTKCVLPNEWMPFWKLESLKAGAIAIKTYAWYNVTYPRRPATEYDCHLTDKSENYQHYVANSNQNSTDRAVDAVSGIFMRNSDGVVFELGYGAGTKGEIGTAYSGWLSQYGSQYIAKIIPNMITTLY